MTGLNSTERNIRRLTREYRLGLKPYLSMDQFGVMYDQAYQLRQLVSKVRPSLAEAGRPALQVCICGVRHGVGASTIAKALADYWRQSGWNVHEREGDRNDVGANRLSQVTVHEATGEPLAVHRGQRQSLGKTAIPLAKDDRSHVLGTKRILLLHDCGTADEPGRLVTNNFARLVLVTTPAPTDVMKAYALVKRSVGEVRPDSLTIVVNKSPDRSLGEEMAKRVRFACRRFLEYELPNLFVLPMFSADDGRGVVLNAQQWCDQAVPSAKAELQTGFGGGEWSSLAKWTETIRSIARTVVNDSKPTDGEMVRRRSAP